VRGAPPQHSTALVLLVLPSPFTQVVPHDAGRVVATMMRPAGGAPAAVLLDVRSAAPHASGA
jgi:hypothetical protein